MVASTDPKPGFGWVGSAEQVQLSSKEEERVMDALAPLASQIIGAIGPYLPALLNAGQGVAQVAGQLEDRDWELAKKLWARLRPTMDKSAAANEAAADLAASPADKDAEVALRLQLRKALASDDQLRQELEALLLESSGGRTVTASGERSVAIGGSASGTIITGDRNRVDG